MRKLTEKKQTKPALKLKDSNITIDINRTLYSENEVIDNVNGLKSRAVCINCEEKPCYKYSKDEIDPLIISGLTYNNSQLVCPTNAINIEESVIKISRDQCIGCGLCSQRSQLENINI